MKTPTAVSDTRTTLKKIAAHRTRRAKQAEKADGARGLGRAARQRRETLRQKRHLEFAGHAQVLLHVRIFLPQLQRALGDALLELGIERAQIGLGLPARLTFLDFPQSPMDRGYETAEPILQDEVGRAALEQFHGCLLTHGTRDDDDRNLRTFLPSDRERLGTVEGGQHVVRQDDVGSKLPDRPLEFAAGLRTLREKFDSSFPEFPGDQFRVQRRVLEGQDAQLPRGECVCRFHIPASDRRLIQQQPV
jgi:hypothetical protein